MTQPTLPSEPSDTEEFWPEPPGGLNGPELRAALEAILLVVDEPVDEVTLAQVLEQPVERVAALLPELSAEYTDAGRGFDLRRAAGGWRLYTRPEQARYVERFVLDGQQARLTQAALETLAVIAYRQPVTRSRVSAIRGVNCDGVIRTLLTRGLAEEAGTEPESGAHLYRTTSVFLEKLGLDSLDQLPPLAPFLPDDLSELDPDRAHDLDAEAESAPAHKPQSVVESELEREPETEPEPAESQASSELESGAGLEREPDVWPEPEPQEEPEPSAGVEHGRNVLPEPEPRAEHDRERADASG